MLARVARSAPAAIAGATVLWLYGDTFGDLYAAWMGDGNYAHGVVVAPVAILLAVLKRKAILSTPVRPTMAGNVLLAAGLALFVLSEWADVMFLAGLSFVLVIAGMLWAFAGFAMLRLLAFPVAFLIFMTPLPDFFVERVGAPLQRVSCSYATMLGGLVGMDVRSQGVLISANGMRFAVDVPCSGIRAITALAAFTAVLAYLAELPLKGRAVIFLLALPVAFAANVLRVFGVIAAANIDGVKVDVERVHTISGPVVFLLAVGLVLFVKRQLEWRLRNGTCPVPQR